MKNFETNWEWYEYGRLVQMCLNGSARQTRNGITFSTFGHTMSVLPELSGFPLIQGRKMFPKGIIAELAAFLKGAQTLKEFEELGCPYWKKWADENGNLNLDYGRSWRDFNGFDQLADLRRKIKENPADRRMIISGWRPEAIKDLSLPCCHMLYQWYVTNDNSLEMIWYQRSVDIMIGMPSDFVLAAAWNMLLANEFGLKPGKLIFMLGDVHIYEEHVELAKVYLDRIRKNKFTTVTPVLDPSATVDNFTPDMLTFENYSPLPKLTFLLKD